jgi:hypothetical protein
LTWNKETKERLRVAIEKGIINAAKREKRKEFYKKGFWKRKGKK